MNKITSKEIKNYIEINLSEKRFKHSLGVANEAKKLAQIYNANEEKAFFAGLAHDLAKELNFEKVEKILKDSGFENLSEKYSQPLIHGPVAAVMLKKEFKILDEEILDAVFYHTTGKENMPLLTKIIYTADFTEDGRAFCESKKAREISYKNLDDAIIYISGCVIINTVERGNIIHPDTVFTRNYLLKQKELKNIK